MGTSRVVAIIGAGNVGSNLARGLRSAGHSVVVGVRDPTGERARSLAADLGGDAVTDVAAAAGRGDVVVLAVPVAGLADAAAVLAPLDGRVVIDATNAVGSPPPGGHHAVGDYVAELLPQARVVKAFNTIGAEHLSSPSFGGRRPALPIAGADDDARAVVAGLVEDLGFEPIDLGGNDAVPLVEAAATIWIRLAMARGWGRDFAFGVLRP